MPVLTGLGADIYVASGVGTVMTGEAVTSLGAGVYQITNAAKRAIDPNSALTVLDGASTVSPATYQVNFGAGTITLTLGTVLAGVMTVTGRYHTMAQAAQGTEWSLDVETNLQESHTFGDSWKESVFVNASGTVSFQRFLNDDYFHLNIANYYILYLYADLSGGKRHMCGAALKSVGVSAGNNDLIKENVSFTVHGAMSIA